MEWKGLLCGKEEWGGETKEEKEEEEDKGRGLLEGVGT